MSRTSKGKASSQATREPAEFGLAREPLGAGGAVISVVGELDIATAPRLREALGEELDRGVSRIVIDLSAVSFVDSVAIGVILHTKMRAGEHGRMALVVVPDSYVRMILEVAGGDSVVDLFESRDEAIAHVGA
jgi:anti-anti-sigma factor